MLQIVSGKFFQSDKRFHNDCRGILYSNARYFSRIDAGHIVLEPSAGNNDIAAFIVSYDNQLEIPDPFPGSAPSRVGDHEILRHIKLISSFSVNAIFDEEKQVVAKIIRDKGKDSGKSYVPSDFFSSDMLQMRYLTEIEIADLVNFFKHMIGLKRDVYLSVINCLAAFNASIMLLDQDINLAYSMLVYCIESLSQRYDSYVPTWDDYDQNKMQALEKEFLNVGKDSVTKIKNILIKDEHLKLSRRFINFSIKYVSDSFFSSKPKIVHQIHKDDVERALINAYNIRSRYAHMLQPIMKQLTIAVFSKSGDTFEFEHDTFFTFSGLLRITKEIISNFVIQQEKFESEQIEWRDQLPDMYTLEMAPQYWVHKPRTIGAMHQFSGFLSILIDSKQNTLPDMRKALQVWVEIFSRSSPEDRQYVLALYLLYNTHIAPEAQCEGWEDFIDMHRAILSECCMANIVLVIVPSIHWKGQEDYRWELSDVANCLNAYNKNKHKPNRLRIPSAIETLIYLVVANCALDEGNTALYDEYSKKAVFNSCNDAELQQDVKICLNEHVCFDISKWQRRIFHIDNEEQVQQGQLVEQISV